MNTNESETKVSEQHYTPERLRVMAASMDPDLVEEALVASLEVQENWEHKDRPGDMDALRMAMVVAALDAAKNCTGEEA